MKKVFLVLLIISAVCIGKAQIYPLTNSATVPPNSYIKDLDNQLSDFEGSWKGTWEGKTITINLIKKIKYYETSVKENPFYKDLLFGKFQVKDANGKILFDNLSVDDTYSKLRGMNIFPSGKYRLIYIDPDLCLKSGIIMIGFTNPEKTEIKFTYKDSQMPVEADCFYYGKPAEQIPESLPKEVILSKQ